LEAQNPDAYSGFLRANSANRHLNILADAVNSAKNQVSDEGEVLFTPAQLGTAATNNANTFSGKIAAASGNRPFNQLATDAQQVMSSKVPDSGTQARLLALGLASGGAAGLGGGGYALGGPEGAGAGLGSLLLLAAGGSKPAQKAMTTLLLRRPEAARSIGDIIARNAGSLSSSRRRARFSQSGHKPSFGRITRSAPANAAPTAIVQISIESRFYGFPKRGASAWHSETISSTPT
jgi:hypothetical protein